MIAHCDANSSGRAATDWGFDSLPCNTARGLRTLLDRDGIARRFCGTPGHAENVARRFGRLSIQMYEGMGDDWDDRKALIDAAILADPEAVR